MDELKPMKDAIVEDRLVSDGIRYINYQPGNGYKYRLLSVLVPGLNDPSRIAYVVTRLDQRGANMNSGFVLEATASLHWTYVKEKFECTEGDARVLTTLFCHLFYIEEIGETSR